MLLVVGVSHRDLDLDDLDRLVGVGPAVRSALSALTVERGGPLRGSAVLNTCNRLEIYADAERFHDAVDAVCAAVAELTGWPGVAAVLKVRVGAPVAAHLFSVAAGLDAMVVGEAEISGQVSAALSAAQQAGVASPALHALFQAAARTAKQVAASTTLGASGRSVASVAIDLATAGVPPRQALIIGTGSYARVAAAALRARGCQLLQVFSPSGRVAPFAATHGAQVVCAADLAAAVAAADLIVACSGHGPVLTTALISAATSLRTVAEPLRIVDLALHADVEPTAALLPGVELVDLRSLAGRDGGDPDDAVVAAQDIVIAAVARFEDDQVVRSLDPAVVALRRHVSTAMDRELTRLRAKYDPEIAAEVERSLHRVTQSLLHTPTLRAKELARTGDTADYLRALHTLFGIDPVPTD